MKRLFTACAACLLAAATYAQDNALWLRYPAISPDGKTIAFGYKGDIYRVDANGGVAVPLTIHEAQDMMPVWSHDGKHLAFASDRYGNFDVFVMPAEGGTPVRLTANSAADILMILRRTTKRYCLAADVMHLPPAYVSLHRAYSITCIRYRLQVAGQYC